MQLRWRRPAQGSSWGWLVSPTVAEGLAGSLLVPFQHALSQTVQEADTCGLFCTAAGVSAFSNGPAQNGGLPHGPASAARSEASLDGASEPEKALVSLQHQV